MSPKLWLVRIIQLFTFEKEAGIVLRNETSVEPERKKKTGQKDLKTDRKTDLKKEKELSFLLFCLSEVLPFVGSVVLMFCPFYVLFFFGFVFLSFYQIVFLFICLSVYLSDQKYPLGISRLSL